MVSITSVVRPCNLCPHIETHRSAHDSRDAWRRNGRRSQPRPPIRPAPGSQWSGCSPGSNRPAPMLCRASLSFGRSESLAGSDTRGHEDAANTARPNQVCSPATCQPNKTGASRPARAREYKAAARGRGHAGRLCPAREGITQTCPPSREPSPAPPEAGPAFSASMLGAMSLGWPMRIQPIRNRMMSETPVTDTIR
jgi:hypothetical protein